MSFQRVPTGIPKLDELIEGGFPSDSMILLVGYPGAGKTTFAGQFLYNGAEKYGARGFTPASPRLSGPSSRIC